MAIHTVLVVFAIVYAAVLVLRANGVAPLGSFLLAIGLALFPPVLNHLVAVSKDTWFAAILLVLFALTSSPRRTAYTSLRGALVALAFFIRPETVLLVPLFFWGEYVLAARRRAAMARYTAALLLTAAALGIFLAQVVKPEHHHAEGGIFLFDLAGISVRTHQLLLTPASFPANDLAMLERHYQPDSLMPIAWGQPDHEMVKFVVGNELIALRQHWLAAIVDNPLAYLRTRAGIVLPYLRGIRQYQKGIDSNTEIHMFWPEWNRRVNGYLSAAPAFLSSHWISILGPGVLLWVMFRLRRSVKHPEWEIYLFVSILYQLLLMPLIVLPDYRFGYCAVN